MSETLNATFSAATTPSSRNFGEKTPGILRDEHICRNCDPIAFYLLNSTLRIETLRLWLRPFTLADLDVLAAINADRDVMRHTGNGEPVSRAETKSRLQSYMRHHREHGFGLWAAVHKQDQVLIGFCGLQFVLAQHAAYVPHSAQYNDSDDVCLTLSFSCLFAPKQHDWRGALMTYAPSIA
jgi:hypothetical protein